MDDVEEKSVSETREPTMLLFVGIAIMLLSFFVVMNHSANVETKRAERVARGVVTHFDPIGASANRFTSNLGEVPGDEATNGGLGKLVATAFPLDRVKVVQPGRVYVVELPLGHMWVEDEVTPTDAGRRFIELMAKMLAEPQARQMYDLDARLVAQAETPRSLAYARIAAFGDAMQEAGAPPSGVATGVDAGERERLRLVFTAREAGDDGR
jgi:hypothetical protein